jgi:hypothetical protein
LPIGEDSPLIKDDFESFLGMRRIAIGEKIRELTIGN